MLGLLLSTVYKSKRISFIILVFVSSFLSFTLYGIEGGAYRLRRVVIDPGHGGKDPGAVGRRSMEKDIVLSVSLKVGEYINQYLPDVEVIYTRTTDEFVELHRRAEIANRNNADLFISIHANSNRNRQVKGTDTFVLGLHRSSENLEIAKRENAVIHFEDDYDDQYQGFDPNSPESYIIFSLMQNTFLGQSLNFATYVQNQFRERVGRVDRGVRQAGFLVLWQTTMPSVLIEVGFLSNEEEERYLMSEQGQVYIASAIFRAFRDYKNTIERKSDQLYASLGGQASPAGGNNPGTAVPAGEAVENENDLDEMQEENGIVFRVQVGSSKNRIPLDSDFFKGVEGIEVHESGGLFRYFVGNASTLEDISVFRKIISDSFPDAFIVALRQGHLIPLQEAIGGK